MFDDHVRAIGLYKYHHIKNVSVSRELCMRVPLSLSLSLSASLSLLSSLPRLSLALSLSLSPSPRFICLSVVVLVSVPVSPLTRSIQFSSISEHTPLVRSHSYALTLSLAHTRPMSLYQIEQP